MACDIRWGTYAGEFKRLFSEGKALRAFATDPRIIIDGERAQRVYTTLLSRLFWLQLAELEEIITPIYEHQIQVQTDRAHIGYVHGRWDKIWEHLCRCEKRSEPWERYWPILQARKAR
jgi:hypothetical protein